MVRVGAVTKHEQALLMRLGGTVASSESSLASRLRFAYWPVGGVEKARGVDWYVIKLDLRYVRPTDHLSLYYPSTYTSTVMTVVAVV